MFTVVLKTYVSDGNYYFTTQNSGMDTVKSPLGMFPSVIIDNDLKYVAEKIRNYYYMDGAKSDEEMKDADEAVKTEINPDEKPKRRRRKAESAEEKIEPAAVEEVKTEPVEQEEQPKVRRRKRRAEAMQVMEISEDQIPF